MDESQYQRKAVMALILNGSKILAVSRKYDQTQFGLPGGKLDEGETYEDAIIREVKEETGLDVMIVKHVFDRMDGDFFAKVYHCVIKDNSQKIQTSESGKVEWVTWYTLFNGPFAEYNRNLHSSLIKQNFFN